MQTRYLERPEGTLAYSDYGGDGEAVLMLPGMGALRSEYRYLAPKLSAAGYRAITIDLRGHGESSVPWNSYDVPAIGSDILACIEYLDAGPAHLIGTSKAAASVVYAAAAQPDYVRSLVLIGPFVRAAKINPVMGAVFWLLMHNPWRVRAWAMYYGTIYPTHKPEDFNAYIKQLMENLAQPGRFDAVNAVGSSPAQPSEEFLNQVKAPTLVIMGTQDPDFPDAVAEGTAVAEQIGGTLELIDGAGHYPQTEMPEKTAPIVTNFLNDTAPQPYRHL